MGDRVDVQTTEAEFSITLFLWRKRERNKIEHFYQTFSKVFLDTIMHDLFKRPYRKRVSELVTHFRRFRTSILPTGASGIVPTK